MFRPKLTYIIPTYNNEDEILRCLDSILSLPLDESLLEIIVVDDCSKDKTREQLEHYASMHSQLKLIFHNENQRPGASTNQGIALATGEYIAFSDGDDEIVTDGVMNAIATLEKSDAEICYYDFEYENPKGIWNMCTSPQELRNANISSADFLEKYYSVDFNAVWRYVIRASFLKNLNLKMVEGLRWEDCDWTVKMQIKSHHICFADGVGYRYGFSQNAVSRQDDYSAMAERVLAGIRLYELADNIRNTHPNLSHRLFEEAHYRYLDGSLRLRNITKYNIKEVKLFYEHFDRVYERNRTQYNPILRGWPNVMLYHRNIAIFTLTLFCPLALLGRKIVKFIR